MLNTSFYEHKVVNHVWKKKDGTAKYISNDDKTKLKNDVVFKNTNVALKEMLEHIKKLNKKIKSLTENNTYVNQIVEIFTHIKKFLSKITGVQNGGPYTRFILWYPILISLIQILSSRIGDAPNIKGYRISKKMKDSALKKWFELLIKKYNYGGRDLPGGSEVKNYFKKNNVFPPQHPYSKLKLREKKLSEQIVENGSEKGKYRYKIEIQPEDATQFIDLVFYRKMALFLKQVIHDCATLLTEDEKGKVLSDINTSLGDDWTRPEGEDTIIKRFLEFAGDDKRKEKLIPFIGNFKSINVNDSNELVVTNSDNKKVKYNENQLVVILRLYSIISEEVFNITKDFENLAANRKKFLNMIKVFIKAWLQPSNITKEMVERLPTSNDIIHFTILGGDTTNKNWLNINRGKPQDVQPQLQGEKEGGGEESEIDRYIREFNSAATERDKARYAPHTPTNSDSDEEEEEDEEATTAEAAAVIEK